MADSPEFNNWLRQLECPQAFTTDYVKKTLEKGVLGLLWEDLPRIVRPLQEVSEARKNILLYKIKNEPKDWLIQSVKNTVHIKEERKKLDAKIRNAEERWRKQEYSCRQKAHLLEKKKEERRNLQLKKEILKIKLEQMQMQIENCSKMQEICNHLMPPTVDEIPQSTIINCLSLVSNYSGGPEKRKVWSTIAESLNPVRIPILWNALLAARSHYTDFIIHLDIEETEDDSSQSRGIIDTGIAKICSEHIDSVAKRFLRNGRMKNNELTTMEYVEKIEQIIEEQRPELTDWLPLALEVKKLEVLQFEFQKEMQALEEHLPVDSISVDEVLMQLIAEIKTIDSQIADRVQEIQNAFGLLKSSGALITKTKESLVNELEKLQLLQTNEESQWLDIELNTELIDFYNNINVDALRKIMLKRETGAYRQLRTCFAKASLTVDAPICGDKVSNFPMLRVPVFYLIDLYKTFIINASLNKRMSEEVWDINEDFPESPLDSPTTVAFPHRGILDLLRLTDSACQKAQQHSVEFEQILKTWSNQTVREVVSKIFCDKTVYGATLDEWQKRFSMIVYVLQKSNINVA
ncbi:hypothetical protein TSAR_006260 [Trichomalopsis sarcophagae]|uniref:Uncharacterized protein n=1 Tax=Trichomalopsis sarcophagae TaxID=543379 RepID=A0A232F7N1_9HYME|nr:hypothetical protein TSAR_006260 [Trichomalopsis sarcophagae]